MLPMVFFITTLLIQTQLCQHLPNRNLTWTNPIFAKKFHAFKYKGEQHGCLFKESANQTVVYGVQCKEYPPHYEVKKPSLKIKMTSIEIIGKQDFIELDHITVLVIEYNSNLSSLVAGCFKPMKSLTELRIILNPKLDSLDANVFEGLDNLKRLSLRKNGFKRVSNISKALSPNLLPTLQSLDLGENRFSVISKYDFAPMNNTPVEELQINLCSIEFMQEESMIYFKKLKGLGLGQNHFSVNSLTQMIMKLVQYNIPLETLLLNDLGFRQKPPFRLLQMISETNITTLSLAQNQFEQLTAEDFPNLPKIKILDLSENLIISIEPKTFDGFTNLEALYLGENKFSKILPAILLPHLKVLDLRMISYKSGTVSYFNIANNVFVNMTKLEQLLLSYNLIESTNNYTFNGLESLRYLELKNATLFGVGPSSFESNKKLLYLNLENNPLQASALTSDTFKGLSELKTLLLGGCNIYNLSLEPSPFYNLSSLTYLGLNNNILYTLTPHIFSPLISLESLDLSNNKLIPWNERLFKNLSLKNIDVSENKFTFLTDAMLDDFKMADNLNLDGNPFICDCNLLPLTKSLDLLISTNSTNIIDTKCSNIEWQQKTIQDFILHLRDNPLTCESKKVNKLVLVSLAVVFLLLLIGLSILVYIYRLYIRYWIFLAKMTVQRRTKRWKKLPKTHTNFTYDAFVSYCCSDCDFINNLVTQLEDNEPHLKLCVYERDFKIGSVISEEVLQNILKSRRTLLVISDDFARSQWCRWETKLAEYHQIFFENDDGKVLDDTLVMIKLNEVQKKHVTPTLKYLMKTRIYLQWDPENESEFWKKLRNSLSAPKHMKNKKTSETVL